MAHAQTVTFTNLWSLEAGSRDYVSSGAFERGIAVNPVTGHVLLVSRAAGVRVLILSGEDGSELGELDLTGVFGGTFPLSAIGVAEDGAIYGANLVTAAADTDGGRFQIYRWANETEPPTVAFSGVPSAGMRFGDSLDVRGARTSTQIALGTAATATAVRFAIFTTTDGSNFTPQTFSPAGVAAGQLQKGITFGEGNTIYGKVNGSPARRLSFDLSSGNSTLLSSVTIQAAISPLSLEVTNKILAGVNITSHQLVIYDFSDPGSPLELVSQAFPPPVTANGNGVGAVDFGPGKLVAVDTQNGIVAMGVIVNTNPTPPIIFTHPQGQTVLEGGSVSFSVAATGTKPLSFQWFFNQTNLIAGATKPTFTIARTDLSNAGNFSVRLSNSVGSLTSSNAVLNVTPLTKSGRFTKIWSLAVGDRTFLASDNSHRGLAFNPLTTNVLVVSRTLGQTNIYVLDGNTGADKHRLRTTDANGDNLIANGLFLLNMIAVTEDGVVYACNLSTSGADFKIYRWANDAPNTIPTIAYGPDNPGIARVGDTLDVRGSGNNTQIIASSNAGTTVAIFTTTDGETFVPTVIDTPDATASNFRLGLAFGAGDSFWGKHTGTSQSLRHVAFDLAAGAGATLQNFPPPAFPSLVSVIGVEPGRRLLAGITLEAPDNLRLYDISDETNAPVLIHQELFATDNENSNGTGSIDFGADRVYALDSNNGIVALKIQEVIVDGAILSIQRQANNVLISWSGPGILQSATVVTGPYADIPAAASPHPENISAAPQKFFRLKR